jgi:uncharacterized repeat protein (TIGR01451 family)
VTGVLVVLVAAFAAVPALADPDEQAVPITNPDLPLGCGIDIHVILDESTSIGQAGATNDVRRAFSAFTSALKNTGSRMAVSEFSTVARLPLPGTASQNYTTVTDSTIATVFNPYINNGYSPNGSTNWEDGFRMGRYFLPRPSPDTPHLTVFITDGDPNVVINDSQVTPTEYTSKVPLASNETTSAQNNAAKDRAVPNANAVKAQGSHILAVAVGAGLNSQASLNRIIDVSGPDVFTGTGTFDLSTDDVYRVPNFSELEEAMREAAFQLCAPSVNVRKQVDVNPDPAVDDLQPGPDWSMTATATPTPASWVLPAGATGPTATTTTGPDGFANFQWTTATPTSSTVSVSEVVQQGYFNDPTKTTCTYRTPDTPTDQPLPGLTVTTGGFTGTVPDEAIVTCTMVNRITPAPAVTIEKSTNGDDADAPPGPFVPNGSPVNWTYSVTNTGNVPLTNVAVSDDQGVAVTCPATTLAVGVTEVCTATGTAAPGPYANIGTVTATGAQQQVTDSDPSHYVGVAPGIDIEKATNGADADFAPGPFVPVGDPVTWTYRVTNTGNSPLTGVTVTDDQGVVVTCPQATLAVAASMDCTAPAAAAVAGQYENRADVVGQSPVGPVQDSDVSHYFGEDASIDVEKFINGQDADTPPGVQVSVGKSVAWTFQITNTGNVPLRWSLTDTQFTAAACPRLLQIAPGQTIHCFGPLGATAQAGLHTNVATATGTAPSGATVDDTDPANYFGVEGGITLKKFTNGFDADNPPGPFLTVGSPITWTYQVTNSGNSALTDLAVTDLRGVAVTCPVATLAAGASTTCTGAGAAAPAQYTNLARATALTPLDEPVSDVDPSNYYGAVPGIHLEKDTNGVDADTPADAPFIPVGSAVLWTYTATNTGNTALTGVTVSDDRGVPVTCPQTTLAAGAEMQCTASGTAATGSYENTGTVTGTDPTSATVSDDDPSHYFGSVSAIRVKKFTNGADADAPPGPRIAPGAPVTWTYQVTNPGNVAIRYVKLVDDKGLRPTLTGGDANGNGDLDPGETWSYRASGTAAPGQYANTATASGFDVLEKPVSDTDPSHYLAELAPPQPSPPQPKPDLRLRKKAMSKHVRSGHSVRFRLRVRNVGDGAARNVKVCDPMPQGLVITRAHGARARGGRACFTVRRLGAHRSRTFTVRARAVITARAHKVCNVATRTARGVKKRRARACVRVLPAVAGGGCSSAFGTLLHESPIGDRPRAHAAC